MFDHHLSTRNVYIVAIPFYEREKIFTFTEDYLKMNPGFIGQDKIELNRIEWNGMEWNWSVMLTI